MILMNVVKTCQKTLIEKMLSLHYLLVIYTGMDDVSKAVNSPEYPTGDDCET